MSRKWCLLLALLLVLAGCGKDKENSAKPKSTSEPTRPPIALEQSYTAATGLTIRYPDGWALTDTEQNMNELYLANSPDALNQMTNNGSNEIPSGMVGLIISEPGTPAEMGLPADSTPQDVADKLVESIAGSDTIKIGGVTKITLSGNDAARINFTEPEKHGEEFMLVFKLGDRFIFGACSAHEGELAGFENTFLSILENLAY